MFRIKSISLYKGIEKKDYLFSDNSYVYGHNNVGKTALTKALDFVLGSSENLSYHGLDNIEEVGAYIVNGKTELWIKRNVLEEYYYKRTKQSKYTLVSKEKYKETICEVVTENIDRKALDVYQKVLDETPTYRSFTFINFLDETGQGDLGSIFTRGKEIRHLLRIRKIMDFFFNYENIEKIYDKTVELDKLVEEQRLYNDIINNNKRNTEQIQELFTRLGLEYTDDMSANFDRYIDYKNRFARKTRPHGDFAYLSRALYSLSEELKIYEYLKEQSNSTENRKKRTERLLCVLKSIVAENEKYNEEISVITKEIENIQQDRLILSLADYDKSIEEIIKEKKKIEKQLELLKNQASDIEYDETLKILACLENCFNAIDTSINITRAAAISNQIYDVKKELKALKNNYSQNDINDFNKRLTDLYLKGNTNNVSYLQEDRNKEAFGLVFDPFSQTLVVKEKKDGAMISYTPGSLARHNHLQLLVYLCMLEFLHVKFENFIYLPILIIDSAEQAMDYDAFDEVYPTFIKIAKNIGVQTIFISKYKTPSINKEDLIDISDGFNPFHSGNG